jgi:MYXO-CTERM domain-containing protein
MRNGLLDTIYSWIEPILNGDRPEDPCQGLDFLGQCHDNIAEWCQRGELRERDCGAVGATCEYMNDRIGYACDCGDLTYEGRCNGDVAQYCDDGVYRSINCQSRSGETCGWVNDDIGYFCTSHPSCLPEDEAGRCDGSVAINCQDGHMASQSCAPQACHTTTNGAICGDGETPIPGDPTADPDSGEPDAGFVGFPDLLGGTSDAEIRAGETGGADNTADGCGCATGGGRPDAGAMLWLFAAVWFVRRRRSKYPTRVAPRAPLQWQSHDGWVRRGPWQRDSSYRTTPP